jgi:hypothetical protein
MLFYGSFSAGIRFSFPALSFDNVIANTGGGLAN